MEVLMQAITTDPNPSPENSQGTKPEFNQGLKGPPVIGTPNLSVRFSDSDMLEPGVRAHYSLDRPREAVHGADRSLFTDPLPTTKIGLQAMIARLAAGCPHYPSAECDLKEAILWVRAQLSEPFSNAVRVVFDSHSRLSRDKNLNATGLGKEGRKPGFQQALTLLSEYFGSDVMVGGTKIDSKSLCWGGSTWEVIETPFGIGTMGAWRHEYPDQVNAFLQVGTIQIEWRGVRVGDVVSYRGHSGDKFLVTNASHSHDGLGEGTARLELYNYASGEKLLACPWLVALYSAEIAADENPPPATSLWTPWMQWLGFGGIAIPVLSTLEFVLPSGDQPVGEERLSIAAA